MVLYRFSPDGPPGKKIPGQTYGLRSVVGDSSTALCAVGDNGTVIVGSFAVIHLDDELGREGTTGKTRLRQADGKLTDLVVFQLEPAAPRTNQALA